MPQDVQRNNTLSITNQKLPDYAEPVINSGLPDYAEPVEQTKPPVEPTFLQRAFEFANKPIVNLMTPEMRTASEEFGRAKSTDSPFSAAARGFVSGGMEGLSDFISSQSSPLGLALEATGAGASVAKLAGVGKLAQTLELPGKIAGAGMVGHGLYNMANEPDYLSKLGAFSEAAMGGAGLAHMLKPNEPKLPPTPQRKLLGPGQYEMPPSSLDGVINEQGIKIAPSQPNIPIRPEGPWSANIDPAQFQKKPTEQIIYDMAREKHNMGKDLPPTAEFRYYQPDGEGGQFAMYDIHGGPLDRSTVSAISLKKHGIPIPKTPEFGSGSKLPHGIHLTEEPQFARTKSGGVQIGADIRSLGKVLGSSLYKGDITKIATKELLQNSLDAVRHLGENGQVEVLFNKGKHPFVEVRDNGKGLTLKEIHSVFSDLGSSGKRGDTEAIGGFGLAKAAPLLGGEKVEVTSIAKEKDGIYKHHFEGTPDQLLDGVPVKSEKVPTGESVSTGTTVKTFVPPDSSFWDANTFVRNLAENSTGMKGKVTLREGYDSYYNTPEVFAASTDKPLSSKTLESDAAFADIIVPEGAKYGPSAGVKYHTLNNGMYQHTGRKGYNDLQGIPDKVLVNIRSKVPEGHGDYPFTANREELRGNIHELINKYIEDEIVSPATGKRIDQLKQVYNSMPKVDLPAAKGKREFFVYDAGDKFTPEELHGVLTDPKVQELATHISDVLHDVMQSIGNSKWDDKLEKIGLIFSENLKGIHIPNPGESKSAILINPFSIIGHNAPDEAAAGILHVILHEIAHVEGGGHDEAFAGRLSDIYEKYGARRALDAQEKILTSIADKELNGYDPKINEVLQRYQEARGRGEIKEDPLLGTGIGAKDKKSDRKRQVPINPSTSRARTPSATIINKLGDALAEAKSVRGEQENLYSMERARRINKAEKIVATDKEGNIKNPGREGLNKQIGALRGELPKTDYEGSKLTESDVDTLIDNVTNSQYLLPYEKIRAKIGLLKLISGGEQVPQHGELDLLGQVFGQPFDRITEMHGGLGGPVAWKIIKDIINVPKAIMASIDLSAPLRQGLALIHKKEWWSALKPMVESFAKQENFDALQQSLKDREKYSLGKEAGLKLTEIDGNPATREEAYGSNLANLIPGVKPSERAYVGFLNKLRADTFDSLIESAKAQGLHPKDVMHEVANFVNVATGRGSLGRLDKIATELNAVFFSPRLIASRLTILNPMYYTKASPFVRREALKSLVAIAGTGLTINSLMVAMGAKTNTSLSDRKGPGVIPGTSGIPYVPVNADFMKSRFGNTRLDPYGGFQQYIVAAGRLLSGETESSETNKKTMLGKSFNADTRKGIIGKFLENKLSPVGSFIDVLLTGKDFQGQPINVQNEITNRFTPMLINDLIDIYKDDPNHLPLGIGSALGMGTQTYKTKPKKLSAFSFRMR